MNEQIFYIWLGWFFLTIVPMCIYLNYRLNRKMGFTGTKLLLYTMNPLIPAFKMDKSKNYRKEIIIMYGISILCAVWIIFPFFVTGTFDASFFKK